MVNTELRYTIQNPHLEGLYKDITPLQTWEERAERMGGKVSVRFKESEAPRSQPPLFSEVSEINRIFPQLPEQMISHDKRKALLKKLTSAQEYLASFYDLDDLPHLSPDEVNEKIDQTIKRIRKQYKGKDVEYFVDYVKRAMRSKAEEQSAPGEGTDITGKVDAVLTGIEQDPQAHDLDYVTAYAKAAKRRRDQEKVVPERETKADIVSVGTLYEDISDSTLRVSLSKMLGKYQVWDVRELDPEIIKRDIERMAEEIGAKIAESRDRTKDAETKAKAKADVEALNSVLGFLITNREENAFLRMPQEARTYNLEIKERNGNRLQQAADLYPNLKGFETVHKVYKGLLMEVAQGTNPNSVRSVGGRQATIAEHLRHLSILNSRLEATTPTNAFILNLKARLDVLDDHSRSDLVKEYIDIINHATYLAQRPDSKLIPPGIDYLEVKNFLYSQEPRRMKRKADDDYDLTLLEDRDRLAQTLGINLTGMDQEQQAAFNQMQQGLLASKSEFSQYTGRGMEQFYFVSELRERLTFIRSLADTPQRDYALARLFGEIMRTGGNAQILMIFVRSWMADVDAGTYDAKLQAGFNLVSKVNQIKNYSSFEDLYKTLGYIKALERAAIYEAKTDGKIFMKVTDAQGNVREEERPFVVGVNDYVATIYNTEVIPEILAGREGFPKDEEKEEFKRKYNEEGIYDASLAGSSNNVKWFTYTVLFKMGFSKEDALCMAENFVVNDVLKDTKGNTYETVYTDRINSVDLTEINSFIDWLSTNWWIVDAGENLLHAERIFYLLATGEVYRARELVGLRPYEDMAGYRNNSGQYAPGERDFRGAQFLPPIDLAAVKEQLTNPLIQLTASGDEEIDKARAKHIRKLIEANMVPPEHAVQLGALAIGIGKFRPKGSSPGEKLENMFNIIDSYMETVEDRNDYARIVPFEFWQYRDIKVTDEEFERVWGDFDFGPLLRRCGWVDAHLDKVREGNQNVTLGKSGWELFVKNANANLFDREGIRDPQKVDSSFRYNVGKQEALKAAMAFFEGIEFEFKARGKETIPIFGLKALREDANFQYGIFMDQMGKLAFPDLSFITNNYIRVKRNISLLWGILRGNGVWGLDTLVTDMKDDDLVKSSTFVEEPLTIKEFKETWAAHGLGDNEIEALIHKFNSHGFYFITSAEEMNDPGKGPDVRFMHGPHYSYVPTIDTARNFLQRLSKGKSRNGTDIPVPFDIQKNARYLLRKGFFNWKFLMGEKVALGADVIKAITKKMTKSDQVMSLESRFFASMDELIRRGMLGPDTVFAPTNARIFHRDPEARGLQSTYTVYTQESGVKPKVHHLLDSRGEF